MDAKEYAERFRAWWNRHKGPLYNASREVLLTAVVTLTPIWAGAVISLLIQEAPSFRAALLANTERGDLFLLSTAAIAPLTLYLSVRPGSLPRPLTVQFPGGAFFVLCLVLLFGAATIMFAIKRASEFPHSQLSLDQTLFLQVSIASYVASLLLAMFVTTTKFAIEGMKPEDIMREDTANFVKLFKQMPKR